jgi:hypothetical protein
VDRQKIIGILDVQSLAPRLCDEPRQPLSLRPRPQVAPSTGINKSPKQLTVNDCAERCAADDSRVQTLPRSAHPLKERSAQWSFMTVSPTAFHVRDDVPENVNELEPA